MAGWLKLNWVQAGMSWDSSHREHPSRIVNLKWVLGGAEGGCILGLAMHRVLWQDGKI